MQLQLQLAYNLLPELWFILFIILSPLGFLSSAQSKSFPEKTGKSFTAIWFILYLVLFCKSRIHTDQVVYYLSVSVCFYSAWYFASWLFSSSEFFVIAKIRGEHTWYFHSCDYRRIIHPIIYLVHRLPILRVMQECSTRKHAPFGLASEPINCLHQHPLGFVIDRLNTSASPLKVRFVFKDLRRFPLNVRAISAKIKLPKKYP